MLGQFVGNYRSYAAGTDLEHFSHSRLLKLDLSDKGTQKLDYYPYLCGDFRGVLLLAGLR